MSDDVLGRAHVALSARLDLFGDDRGHQVCMSLIAEVCGDVAGVIASYGLADVGLNNPTFILRPTEGPEQIRHVERASGAHPDGERPALLECFDQRLSVREAI